MRKQRKLKRIYDEYTARKTQGMRSVLNFDTGLIYPLSLKIVVFPYRGPGKRFPTRSLGLSGSPRIKDVIRHLEHNERKGYTSEDFHSKAK